MHKLKALNLLKDRISYLHIKDISETTGEIVPAGKGDAKISELINFMDAKPGVTVLTVEPHLSHFEGYETLDKHKLINKYTFTSANEAFDCAVNALKKIMYDLNFKETNGIWKR